MPERTKPISVEESGAFVEQFGLPPTGSGPLDGLRFAIKDIIDVAGRKTGCGNPRWRETHPPAVANAVCVDQLLAAGARAIGKVLTDQLAFSLLGENYHYGTPLNPKAPERVPGGSSSGSASAVACGLVDFALGTDTGGSVRVPASNCGIFGMRPTHDIVSVAGVMPFAPTFDTVGVLAVNADILCRAAAVLLSCEPTANPDPGHIHLVKEAFALVDPEVRKAHETSVQRLRDLYGHRVRETSLREIDGETADVGLQTWFETYCVLQWAEIWNCLGPWIVEAKPDFGETVSSSFELPKNLDRRRVAVAARRRESYFRRLKEFLRPHDLLCFPTTPTPAPLKGGNIRRDQSDAGYYGRALSLTAVAGIGRLPQVSLPLAAVDGLPLGLSLLAANGHDDFLLGMVRKVAARVST